MKLKIINPNTSPDMTKSIAKAAQTCANPDTEVITVCLDKEPVSIENFHNQYTSVLGII